MKQLICGSLNRMRIRQSLPTAIHTPDRNAGLLEGAVAGSNPGARAAAECRETGGGDVREEIVVRSASRGKPGSRGSMVITTESCAEGGAMTIASLSPHASISAEQ